VSEPTVVLDWGGGWAPVEPAITLQAELMAELGKAHPLKDMSDGRWPYFERMTVDEFTRRFLREGEHM
jgi:hypothetical protein